MKELDPTSATVLSPSQLESNSQDIQTASIQTKDLTYAKWGATRHLPLTVQGHITIKLSMKNKNSNARG